MAVQMISKVNIYKELLELYELMNDEIAEGKVDIEDFVQFLLDTRAFESEKDVIMFLIEKVFDECKSFDGQFPIKYYNSDEEFDNDDVSITEDDLEHLTDEYIEQKLH